MLMVATDDSHMSIKSHISFVYSGVFIAIAYVHYMFFLIIGLLIKITYAQIAIRILHTSNQYECMYPFIFGIYA